MKKNTVLAFIIKFQIMPRRKVNTIVSIYHEVKPNAYHNKIINNQI